MEKIGCFKNIIFDLGCVLVSLEPKRCIEAFEQLGAKSVANYIETHATKDLFLEIETGRISQTQFCNKVSALTNKNIEHSKIVEAWNSLIGTIPEHKLVALEQLAKNHNLYILSNTNIMHWNKCVPLFIKSNGRSVLPLFKNIFLSYQMNMAKPDVNIFNEVVKQANIDVSNTIFIDDLINNCTAAQTVGMHTFNHNKLQKWYNFI